MATTLTSTTAGFATSGPDNPIVVPIGTTVSGPDGISISGAAGTVSNSGAVMGTTGTGILLNFGGAVSNAAGALVQGAANGVYATGASATIDNAGNVSGSGPAGEGVVLAAGGTVSNTAGATISGLFGVEIALGGSVANAGSIQGSGGDSYGVYADDGATVTNAGTISGGIAAVFLGGNGGSRLILDPGQEIDGIAEAQGGGNILELAAGIGALSGLGTRYSGFDTLAVDAGATWSLAGNNAASRIVDNGLLTLGPGAALSVADAFVADPGRQGSLALADGATLDLAGPVGQGETIDLGGRDDVLVVRDPAEFGGVVNGFKINDQLDLAALPFTPGASANYDLATDGLAVTSGGSSAAIGILALDPKLDPNFVSFSLVRDASGGTSVILTILPPSAPALSPASDGGIPGDGVTDIAAPMFTGSALPGSTVTLYDTDGTTVLGTGIADPASGAYAITTAPLSDGPHTVTAAASDPYGDVSPRSGGTTITIDTQSPGVDFNPGIRVRSGTVVTLSGNVADAFGVADVSVYANGADLGSAIVGANGAWHLTADFGAASLNDLQAVATGNDGNTAAAPAPFALTTGLHGPYAVEKDNYAADGAFLGSDFYTRRGTVYEHSSFEALPNGDQSYTYGGGSRFRNLPNYAETQTYTPDGNLAVDTLYNNDGTHTISAVQDGQHVAAIADDTFTNDGSGETFVFTPSFGAATITDFQAAGRYHDVLNLPSTLFSGLAQVLQHTTMSGNDAVIHVDRQDSITLQNVTRAELQAHPQDVRFHV